MGYIFESEIERIMHAVRARTIGESDTITLRDILTARIHPAIKAYFKAEVERQLLEERQLEIRSKKFSYSVPEVASLQHQMDLLLMVHYQFDQNEFDTMLDQAIHFTFNFLCRPQFTLMEFLFENQRQQSTMRIEQKLNYCVDYEYYSVLLKRYFAERGLASVSYEEFRQLLARIDNEVVSQHSGAELANMTRAIVAFVEAADVQPDHQGSVRSLPINASIVYFEDKNLSEIKLRLEYERDHKHVTDISMDRLAEIIEEVRTIASGGQVSSKTVEEESAPSQTEDDRTVEVTINDLDKAIGATGQKREPEKGLEEEISSSSTIDTPVTAVSASPSDSVDVVPPEVASLLTGSETKKILKSIFHKDEDEFQSTLGLLDQAPTWEEASLILDDLFLAKGIDPQSKVAILLTEKVFQRYHPVSD